MGTPETYCSIDELRLVFFLDVEGLQLVLREEDLLSPTILEDDLQSNVKMVRPQQGKNTYALDDEATAAVVFPRADKKQLALLH